MKKKDAALLKYIAKNLATVIGIVLVWRGIWYVLDFVDLKVFQDEHLYTAIGGIIIGLFMLYLPDKDLKELEKL